MQYSTKTLRVDPFRPEFHPVCESQSSGQISLSNTSTMCQWPTKNSELEVASDTYWSRIQNLELEQPILRYILWLFYDMFYLLWYSEVNLSTQLSQVTCRQCLVAFRGATSSKGHFSRITTSVPRLNFAMAGFPNQETIRNRRTW